MNATGKAGSARRGALALRREEVARLREANEALLCSALDAQTRAEHLERALDELGDAAKLDPLTRLPNRLHLLDRFEHAMAQARRSGSRVAVLFVDLDGFKQINDQLGHSVGDHVLQWAAEAITGAVREVDTVSRHGGDEFVIVLDMAPDADTAVTVARKIIAALDHRCRVGESSVHLSASIGISLFPDHGEDAATLIAHADAAMYQAKRSGAGTYFIHGGNPVHVDAGHVGADPKSSRAVESVVHDTNDDQMQEANSQLVLAALGAQDLLAICKDAQQRQASFMGVLAHELRSPLTPIRVAAGMLGHPGDDDALQEELKSVIDGQITRMATLIDDLLDVSRIRTGKLTLSLQRIDIADLVETAVDSARLSTKARGQHIDLVVPEQPLMIRGDPARLSQVLTNLLDNAARYSPKGGRITVEVDETKGVARIAVADSGIGISKAALPTIFEPFIQDTHAVGYSKAGLGIGLTVVRELVLAHSGTIKASSDGVGCGSRFVLSLPLDGMDGASPPHDDDPIDGTG